MNSKFIIIVLGEPYSTFSEILGKYFTKVKKFKKKIILVGNTELLKKQLVKMNFTFQVNEIENYKQAKKNIVNMINVDFSYKKIFDNISKKSNSYIEKSFNKSLEIIKENVGKAILINGPVSKKLFLIKSFRVLLNIYQKLNLKMKLC